jgi:serine/threonine protein kinase
MRDSDCSTSRSVFGGPWDEGALPVDSDGRLFVKYRVIRKLADGGRGSVWLVELVHSDPRVGIQRALKVMKSDVADREPFRRRFEQLFMAQDKLKRHPNVVTVFAAGLEGTFAYLEMEYLDGQTLSLTFAVTHRCSWPYGDRGDAP